MANTANQRRTIFLDAVNALTASRGVGIPERQPLGTQTEYHSDPDCLPVLPPAGVVDRPAAAGEGDLFQPVKLAEGGFIPARRARDMLDLGRDLARMLRGVETAYGPNAGPPLQQTVGNA